MGKELYQASDACRTPNNYNEKMKLPMAGHNNNPKSSPQKQNFKGCQKKQKITYKGKVIRITADFSIQTLKAKSV